MKYTVTKHFYYLLASILLISNSLHAQYFLYNDTPKNIEIEFTKHSIEVKSKQVFFNALKITNKSGQTESFNLNLTVPQDWNIIGNEKAELTLNPYDSIIVPIRVAVGAKVRGDIGYSIIASITDSRNNTIKNAYCFVKIPHEYNLKVKFLGGISYIDPSTLTSEFSVRITNMGNREEPVNLYFDGQNNVTIGSKAYKFVSYDITVPPFADTILTYNVALINEHDDKKLYPLTAKIKTTYFATEKNIWFNKLDSKYTNHINPTDKALSIELIAQGLMDSEREPTITSVIEGKTYLNGRNDIYYYYRNYDSKKNSDFYEKARMYIGANIGNWNIEIGDNIRNLESPMSGRGGYLAFRNSHNAIELLANKTVNDDLYNYGGSYAIKPIRNLSFKLGGAYNHQESTNLDSKVGFFGLNFNINNKHILNFVIGLNKQHNDSISHQELGGKLYYTSKFKKVTSSINSYYYGKNFYSPYAGRLDFNSTTTWNINNKNTLSCILNDIQIESKPTKGTQSSKLGYEEGKIEHNYFVSKRTNLFWGPSVSHYTAKDFSYFVTDNTYVSINYKLTMGARIKILDNNALISPRFEIVKSRITKNPFVYQNNKSNSQYFSINFRMRGFNLVTYYNSGARTINDQINNAYQNKLIRKLQFIPSYDAFVYKDIVNLYLGLSYSNNLSSNLSNSNITGRVTCYLPKNWRFYVMAVYSLQKRKTTQDAIETYQTFYAEASLKKEFDIQQPRIKYHDLTFSFFKDFNGNYLQDENEPGIKNVLVRIEKIKSDVKGRIPSDFVSADLLSDNTGIVNMENIPEGLYSISYNPIGAEAGTYSKAKDIVEFKVDRSGDYFFPFVEKNKVFGKIILNRSRLSGIGKVDVSNIRITATDSRGNTFSTLTNKEGQFIIYAPVTDEYVVNINNIFYENFDLRQNNFRVQFNGYKQFEVNFVFDEKIRRINFSPSTQDNLAEGVMQIRRTNLRGTIKDATSLKPLRARINLVNTKNNSIVSSVYSNAQTGDYGLSFLADDIYLLEIVADDYWYFSENLNLNQVTTFMNVTKDILLKQITIGSKIELNIRFAEINKSNLGPETVAELNRLLRILKDNSNIKIEIQGHCDDLEAINNPQIGEERAKAVAKYLIENGFSNLQVRGFGNTAPIAPSDTEENRTLNRRVDIEVISK